MAYRICKTFEIESGHMLSKHPEKCAFPHGHTRKVEFVIEADELDDNDMVCDFKIIKLIMCDFLESLDHSMCINTDDRRYGTFKDFYGDRVIGFESTDPTTEVMAKMIFDFFKQKLGEYRRTPVKHYPLRDSLRIVKVRLWETSNSWAEYWEPQRECARQS
jgi:6-pyruvoyltetrahydropterin/6-carboxytetrahydropterin synthase